MTPTPAHRLFVAVTSLFAAACAQSNGDINRVQPNVVKKADLLDGEWFYRNTVTYTPFDTQFTYPGQTGTMEKLVWEIQENNLVGYRSYPYSPGVESNVDPTSRVSGTTASYCDAQGVCAGGKKYYGAPVVAFPVQSQFDIQRGYNPATGEVTNVISENATDRPWNQREFIRVNWSANLLNKNSGMNWGTIQNPGGGSSSSSWIQANEKGEDPYDWPNFEYADRDASGARKLTYLDVTGRYMANPDLYFIEDYGWVPTCWLSGSVTDCSSSEIKMRVSISKVDKAWARDYEPLIYPNDLMSLFGYFRTERLNYDRKFGYNDSAVIRLAQRHRVWNGYYRKGADGEPLAEAPLPLKERTPKPVVYYFTPAERMGGPERYAEFWEPGRKLEAEYDRAFRRAIAAAEGKDAAEVPQMFYLCNNPVKQGDPAACGQAGLKPRVGDLRYSFVNTVAEPVANGLLGYGPSSADPETGQIMSGMSNTYLWGVDLYGREVLDHMLLLTGEKSAKDYASGKDMQAFIQSNPAYNLTSVNSQTAALKSELQGIPQTRDETVGAWQRPTARISALIEQLKVAKGLPKASRDDMKVAADQLAQNPELEAAILDNPDVQADLLGLLPPVVQTQAQQDPAFLRKVSRTVLTNIQASDAWQKARLSWVSRNNVMLSEFYDHTLVGVAAEKLIERKQRIALLNGEGHPTCANARSCTVEEATCIANEEIAKWGRQQVWLATALHETGHTLNLRHNFQGSFDAINYQDGYWPLRKATLTMEQNGEQKLPRTPADLKAALDGNQSQLVHRMHDYEYSSIMDYAGKIYGDWQGIGKYDEAAIIFAYSGTTAPGYVEVFQHARQETRQFAGTDGRMMSITGAANDLPIVNATHLNPNVRNYTERYHYTTVPLHFGEGADLASTIDDGIARLRQRDLRPWAEVKADEARVAAAVQNDPALQTDPTGLRAVTGREPLLRVPYMFCSDDSADGPVLSCNRFDRGPDYYEMVRSKTSDYWNYYFDSHYRRDKAWFSSSRAFNSSIRAFMFTADSYKHWVYEFYRQSAGGQEQVARYTLDPTMQDTWTMAVLDGVNQHLNVMSVPPFGHFMFRKLAQGDQWDILSEGVDYDPLNAVGEKKYDDYYASRYNATAFANLSRGLGRRMYSRYDFKSGYGFFQRMAEAGHYNDQIGAMYAAVLPQLQLQGVDLTADSNRYNLPYYLVFRNEFQDTFAALWSNDETKVRPTLFQTLDANGPTEVAGLEFPVHVRGADLFAGFNYPKDNLKTCTGNQQPPACYSPDQKAAPVNIQTTWTSRIYALYFGLSLFKVNYDLDYAKANQLFKLGGAEQATPQPGYHQVETADFLRGARYVALEKDGAPPNSTPAVRMINNANEYLIMYGDPTRCPLPPFLDRSGYTCMTAADANNPAQVADRKRFWAEVFQNGIRDLDLMRGYYGVFGKAF